MSELKNIKVSPAVHEALTIRADRLGMKQGKLAEALIMFGLKQQDRKLLEEVITLVEMQNDKNG